eukprot:jgi/Bigna1/74228/fgenesh1_pg.28_\
MPVADDEKKRIDVKYIKRLAKTLAKSHPKAWQNPRVKNMYRKLLEGTYECDFSKLDVENMKLCLGFLRQVPTIKNMKIQFLSRTHAREEKGKGKKKKRITRHGFPPIHEIRNRLASVLPEALHANKPYLEMMSLEGVQQSNFSYIGKVLSQCSGLETLRIRNCNLGDARLTSFLPCLRTGYGKNAPTEVQRLMSVDRTTQQGIVSLDISNNQLGDEFVEELCHTLRSDKWVLSNNADSCGWGRWTSALDLESTAMTRVGLEHIMQMLKDNETLLQIRVGRGWKDPQEKAIVKSLREKMSTRRREKFAEFTMSKLETGDKASRPWWHTYVKKSRRRKTRGRSRAGSQASSKMQSREDRGGWAQLMRDDNVDGVCCCWWDPGNSTRVGSGASTVVSSRWGSRDGSPSRSRSRRSSMDVAEKQEVAAEKDVNNVGRGALNLSMLESNEVVVVGKSKAANGARPSARFASRIRQNRLQAQKKAAERKEEKIRRGGGGGKKKSPPPLEIDNKEPFLKGTVSYDSAAEANNSSKAGGAEVGGAALDFSDKNMLMTIMQDDPLATATWGEGGGGEGEEVDAKKGGKLQAMIDEILKVYQQIGIESFVEENRRMEAKLEEMKQISREAANDITPVLKRKKMKKRAGLQKKRWATSRGKQRLTVNLPESKKKKKKKNKGTVAGGGKKKEQEGKRGANSMALVVSSGRRERPARESSGYPSKKQLSGRKKTATSRLLARSHKISNSGSSGRRRKRSKLTNAPASISRVGGKATASKKTTTGKQKKTLLKKKRNNKKKKIKSTKGGAEQKEEVDGKPGTRSIVLRTEEVADVQLAVDAGEDHAPSQAREQKHSKPVPVWEDLIEEGSRLPSTTTLPPWHQTTAVATTTGASAQNGQDSENRRPGNVAHTSSMTTKQLVRKAVSRQKEGGESLDMLVGVLEAAFARLHKCVDQLEQRMDLTRSSGQGGLKVVARSTPMGDGDCSSTHGSEAPKNHRNGSASEDGGDDEEEEPLKHENTDPEEDTENEKILSFIESYIDTN